MTATVTTGRKPRSSDSAGAGVRRGQRSARPGSGRKSGAAMPEGRSAAAQKAYERRQRRAGAVRGDGGLRSHGGDTLMLAKRIPFVVLVLGLLVSGMGFTLWLSTHSTGQSYEVSAAKQKNRDLQNQKAALEQAVEAGNSAPDLARKAQELGMVQSRDVARLILGPDGVVRLEGTPQAADGPAPAPLTAVRPGPATPAPAPDVVRPLPTPLPPAHMGPIDQVPPPEPAPVEEDPAGAPVDEAPVPVPPPGEAPPPAAPPALGLPLVEASDPGVGQ